MDFSIKEISESEYPSFTATTDYIAQICFHDGLVLLAQTATGKPVGMLAARNGLTNEFLLGRVENANRVKSANSLHYFAVRFFLHLRILSCYKTFG